MSGLNKSPDYLPQRILHPVLVSKLWVSDERLRSTLLDQACSCHFWRRKQGYYLKKSLQKCQVLKIVAMMLQLGQVHVKLCFAQRLHLLLRDSAAHILEDLSIRALAIGERLDPQVHLQNSTDLGSQLDVPPCQPQSGRSGRPGQSKS